MMSDRKSQLLTRKRDVFAAIHVLEQDHVDGLVTEEAYTVTKQRYEQEAVELLSQLEALGEGDERTAQRDRERLHPRGPRLLLLAGAAILAVAGAVTFLIMAAHQRGPGETITGAVGQGGSDTSGQAALSLQAAQQAVYQHPRSYEALVNLGTAYLQNGRVMEADLSYQAAMRADPSRAAAPTFHAMLLGAVKRYAQALALLSRIERNHPAYARAWLMDGILASHVKGERKRAVSAWLRFLLLDPQSDLAPKVRRWIVQAQRKR